MESRVVKEFHLIMDEWEFMTFARLLDNEVFKVSYEDASSKDTTRLRDLNDHVTEIKEKNSLF